MAKKVAFSIPHGIGRALAHPGMMMGGGAALGAAHGLLAPGYSYDENGNPHQRSRIMSALGEGALGAGLGAGVGFGGRALARGGYLGDEAMAGVHHATPGGGNGLPANPPAPPNAPASLPAHAPPAMPTIPAHPSQALTAVTHPPSSVSTVMHPGHASTVTMPPLTPPSTVMLPPSAGLTQIKAVPHSPGVSRFEVPASEVPDANPPSRLINSVGPQEVNAAYSAPPAPMALPPSPNTDGRIFDLTASRGGWMSNKKGSAPPMGSSTPGFVESWFREDFHPSREKEQAAQNARLKSEAATARADNASIDKSPMQASTKMSSAPLKLAYNTFYLVLDQEKKAFIGMYKGVSKHASKDGAPRASFDLHAPGMQPVEIAFDMRKLAGIEPLLMPDGSPVTERQNIGLTAAGQKMANDMMAANAAAAPPMEMTGGAPGPVASPMAGAMDPSQIDPQILQAIIEQGLAEGNPMASQLLAAMQAGAAPAPMGAPPGAAPAGPPKSAPGAPPKSGPPKPGGAPPKKEDGKGEGEGKPPEKKEEGEEKKPEGEGKEAGKMPKMTGKMNMPMLKAKKK